MDESCTDKRFVIIVEHYDYLSEDWYATAQFGPFLHQHQAVLMMELMKTAEMLCSCQWSIEEREYADDEI